MADLPTDAAVVAELARTAQGVQRTGVDARPFVIAPPGHEVKSVEQFALFPARERGDATLHDLDSFIRYTLAINVGEVHWQLNEQSAKFVAVFNSRAWRDHRATYAATASPEWKRWTGMNGQRKPQADFAAFVEDNALDIVDPVSADMIEISRSLEAKKKVEFKSAIRLSNGQTELAYQEDISGSAAKGKLAIPETFRLGIPVFVGGERYSVECRLRYRIDNGTLSMWFDLIRPHAIIQDATERMVDEVKSKITLPIYRGDLPVIS